MPIILATLAVALAAYALYQFRVNRVRGRMFACLAIALGLTWAHAGYQLPWLKWLSWAFLALALAFMAQGRRRSPF